MADEITTQGATKAKAKATKATKAPKATKATKAKAKAKAVKAVKATKTEPPKATRPTTHTNEQVITVLVEGNPKRPGTKAWAKWELYKRGKKGMTVGEYLAAGGKRSTLRWDEARELISIT